MKNSLLLLLSIIFFNTEAQINFHKNLGGTGSEVGYSVCQTTDSGYIITGYTNSFGAGGDDVYLIKTDSNGNIVWTKTFGGTGDDFGYSVKQTSDGGYIIVGSTGFGAGGKDIYLIKTNSSGNLVWSRTYGNGNDDVGNSVEQTSDGGYIIGGIISGVGGGACLIKTDSFGAIEWQNFYNRTEINSVRQTYDHGYILVGGIADIFVIKTDSAGNTKWSNSYGGTEGNDIIQTSDSGFVICGAIVGTGQFNPDAFLIKIDSLGAIAWSKTYGSVSSQDRGFSIQPTVDGGLIVCGMGQTNFTGSSYLPLLFKTDSNGDTLWTRLYYTGFHDYYFFSVQQTFSGGFIITGRTFLPGLGGIDVYLVNTDSIGHTVCNQNPSETIITSPLTQVTPLTLSIQTGCIVATPPTMIGSGGSSLTVCIDNPVGVANNSQSNNIVVSPNPSSGLFNILSDHEMSDVVIEIFNSLGEKVYDKSIARANTIDVDLKNINAGIYFLVVRSSEGSFKKKLFIQ
jgi:hypothetical protein